MNDRREADVLPVVGLLGRLPRGFSANVAECIGSPGDSPLDLCRRVVFAEDRLDLDDLLDVGLDVLADAAVFYWRVLNGDEVADPDAAWAEVKESVLGLRSLSQAHGVDLVSRHEVLRACSGLVDAWDRLEVARAGRNFREAKEDDAVRAAEKVFDACAVTFQRTVAGLTDAVGGEADQLAAKV